MVSPHSKVGKWIPFLDRKSWKATLQRSMDAKKGMAIFARDTLPMGHEIKLCD